MRPLQHLLALPGCPQCAAEEVLTQSLAEVKRGLATVLISSTALPGISIEDEIMLVAREMRLAARIALLEPHECGGTPP